MLNMMVVSVINLHVSPLILQHEKTTYEDYFKWNTDEAIDDDNDDDYDDDYNIIQYPVNIDDMGHIWFWCIHLAIWMPDLNRMLGVCEIGSHVFIYLTWSGCDMAHIFYSL